MHYSWNIIGHEQELTGLERDFLNHTVHHAYLFTGPEKIGKFRVAKVAAQILQCPNEACHTCPTCIQLEKKSHPDTIELEDDGESLKIGLIRDLIARLHMTGQSRYKILLIQNIGRLTEEAANCLLKILEEPPPGTIFIFTAAQLRDIPTTIASRMRTVHFRMLPDEVLAQALTQRYPELEKETLDQILLLSLGRSGRALALLSNAELFRELRETYREIQFLDEKAALSTRLIAMHDISADEQKLHTFLTLLALYFRHMMLTSQIYPTRMRALRILEHIHRTSGLLRRNINTRLVMEHLMLNWSASQL